MCAPFEARLLQDSLGPPRSLLQASSRVSFASLPRFFGAGIRQPRSANCKSSRLPHRFATLRLFACRVVRHSLGRFGAIIAVAVPRCDLHVFLSSRLGLCVVPSAFFSPDITAAVPRCHWQFFASSRVGLCVTLSIFSVRVYGSPAVQIVSIRVYRSDLQLFASSRVGLCVTLSILSVWVYGSPAVQIVSLCV